MQLKKAVDIIFKYTNKHKYIAVGYEEAIISIKGSISLLTLASRSDIFAFDILELGKYAFEHGIALILENNLLYKIVFDCREPAGVLYHVYGVMLTCVLDVQLLLCIYEYDVRCSKNGDIFEK